MGKTATELLVKKMQTPDAEATTETDRLVVLPNELRVRGSTAPPHLTFAEPVILER
jgi:DNA-binding LacI/PurR family transcriptional regulator